MTTKEIIQDRLNEASLSDEGMSVWALVLENLTESELGDIQNSLEVSNDALKKITDNLILKKKALDGENIDIWMRALDEEEKLISSPI